MATDEALIGLFGNFGTGNFGNDGSLEAIILSLRRVAPNATLHCICGNADVVQKAFDLPTTPINVGRQNPSGGRMIVLARKIINKILMWPYAVGHLKRFKALIIPGTGILDDFRIGPFGWPYDLFCWFLLARLMGVKVMLVSIGAGPIHSPLSRWFLKAAAGSASYRSYRDEASKSFMTGIGFDASNDPIFPDLAFNLPTPPNAPSGEDRPTVGVGVMTYYGWRKNAVDGDAVYDAYIAKMSAYIRWLVTQGYRVRILMGDYSDQVAVNDILGSLAKERGAHPDDHDIVFAPAHTLNDIMQQMADIDVAVATRFHNVVCALKMRKPTISISYAPKNDVLLSEMGLGGFSQHIERLDIDLLKQQTLQLLEHKAAFERTIHDVCGQFETALRKQDDQLGALLSAGTT